MNDSREADLQQQQRKFKEQQEKLRGELEAIKGVGSALRQSDICATQASTSGLIGGSSDIKNRLECARESAYYSAREADRLEELSSLLDRNPETKRILELLRLL